MTRSLKIAALLLTSAVPCAAQNVDPDTLRWLSGRWIGTVGQAIAEEQWSDAAAGSKMGMFRWIQNGSIAVYEFLIIRREEQGLVLRFKHFDQGLRAREDKDEMVVMPAVSVGPQEVVFERKEPALRVTYRLESPGKLISILENGTGAAMQRTVFTFSKAGG